MDRKSVTAAPEAAREPAVGHAGLHPTTESVRDAGRVDAHEIEQALLTLRERIAAAPLLLDAPGVAQARAERKKLLSQIDDYLLPRLHRPAGPILVALVGSTGAGKSTLVNSIVGERVSATGIRRPTTNSPVLACHPGDAEWFAENRFLPTLPRVRQEGLARPGRDGLLVIAASAQMPQGLALLDTPDIDSVVRAHYEFAHQFLDASDLWLFVTTAARYADAPVWDLLQHARERGAALGIVLSRVPETGHNELVGHFCAMLDANGVNQADRFVIPETVVTDGMLPAQVFAPVRSWLEEAAMSEDRRVAVLTQTMSGVLDTFRARVPELAAQVEAQVALRAELAGVVREVYDTTLADLDDATRNGSLLRGEVLARWQDFAGTGELLHTLQIRHPRGPGRQPRKRRSSLRLRALESALRSGLESLIVSLGDRAAERAVARWREHPVGVEFQVPARLPELRAANMGRVDQIVAAVVMRLAPEILDDRPQPAALGVPEDQTRADVLADGEEIQLAAELPVVALLRLGETVHEVVQLCLREECRAVDALQLLVVLVTLPIRAGD